MVDPVPVRNTAVPTVDGDRAEVDLPVASNVLGAESIFLQARQYIIKAICDCCVQFSLAKGGVTSTMVYREAKERFNIHSKYSSTGEYV